MVTLSWHKTALMLALCSYRHAIFLSFTMPYEERRNADARMICE